MKSVAIIVLTMTIAAPVAGARVGRAFGVDAVRVSCGLKAEAPSTPVSLFLRWDASDFIQFGINSPASGHLNVREVVGVKDHPFDIGVAADGSLQLSDNIADYKKPTAFFQIGDYRFGSGHESCAKKLLNGWMPIVVTSDSHDGLELEQTVFGWSKDCSPDEPLFGYVQFHATNPSDTARTVNLQLVFTSGTNTPSPLVWQLNLPAHGSRIVSVRVPYKILESPATEVAAGEFQNQLAAVTAYWEKLIARGSRFEIPEARVQNAWRAWLAYDFLNVAKRKGVYEVCDGSGFYGKVYGYSAALFCNGLDLLGYNKLAETYCDSLLSFMHTNGLLAVNFGDTDTGAALWMMAEHYRLTSDRR